MKAACTATGVILTAKNFIANANGKAIARQTVMVKQEVVDGMINVQS